MLRHQFEYRFEWNSAKAKGNLSKHRISFDRAATVFQDASALSTFDSDHSETEDRWVTLGLDQNGILLVVCHTFVSVGSASAEVRIFSARKATRNEAGQYRRHNP